jgi:ferredoxin
LSCSIKITFQDSKGQTVTQVEGNEGDDLLSLAHEWDVDLEGACEGSIACSTCHVILDAESYDKLEEPEDDENDMLDLAFGLSDTWVRVGAGRTEGYQSGLMKVVLIWLDLDAM